MNKTYLSRPMIGSQAMLPKRLQLNNSVFVATTSNIPTACKQGIDGQSLRRLDSTISFDLMHGATLGRGFEICILNSRAV